MQDARVLDLVGIGFGPAGVALAAAIDDLGERMGYLKRLADEMMLRAQDFPVQLNDLAEQGGRFLQLALVSQQRGQLV